jgi:hypothetical protein
MVMPLIKIRIFQQIHFLSFPYATLDSNIIENYTKLISIKSWNALNTLI